MTEQDKDIWLKIIKRMHQRREKGYATYDKPLVADDARNWFRELQEELLDAIAYAEAGAEKMDWLEQRVAELEEQLYAANERIIELREALDRNCGGD